MHIKKLTVTVAAVVAMTLSGVPALAVGALGSHANAAATGGTAEARLTDAKLKACQNRQAAINNIMARIASRGQKQLDLFTTIADRTETFYTNKGKTLSNYDALVADVAAKKAAATIAVLAVKTTSVNFSCDGPNPQAVVEAFKESLKLEISSLKDYRTAVKNLIVGVKSVQGTTSSTQNKTNSTTNDTTGGSQ